MMAMTTSSLVNKSERFYGDWPTTDLHCGMKNRPGVRRSG